MRCMRLYHEKESEHREIRVLMDEIEFMARKGLYEHIGKTINKAKKLAEKYELFPELIRIYSVEKFSKSIQGNFDDVENNIKQKIEILNKIENQSRHELFFNQLHRVTDEQYISEDSAQKMKDAVSYFNELKVEEPSGFYGQENKLMAQLFLFQGQSNFHGAYKICEELVVLYESNPQFIKAGFSWYVPVHLLNLLAAQYGVGHYEAIFITSAKIGKAIGNKRYKSTSENYDTIRCSFTVLCYETIAAFQLAKFKQAMRLVLQAELVLTREKENNTIPAVRKMTGFFVISAVYFSAGDTRKALGWIRKILEDKLFEKFSPRTVAGAKIFFLILHYELKNLDLLLSAFRSTYRFLRLRKSLGEFERIVLDHMRLIPVAPTNKQEIEIFKKLRGELLKLSNDAHSFDALRSYRIISWLDSKIEKRPFQEIVREKVAKGIEF